MVTPSGHPLAVLLAIAGATILAPSCVPNLEIEGAPCPCPEGFQCCASLNDSCLADGQECPQTYPASSGASCAGDEVCREPHELCQSWTVDDRPSGPGKCRRRCPESDIPCAPGEVCELTPHDGAALGSLRIERLCVPGTPPEGCENQGCRECSEDMLEMTFCSNDDVCGCFLALHPICGLTCRQVVVQDCDISGCMEIDGGARCTEFGWGEWCAEYSCSGCGLDGLDGPGSFFCDGSDLVACTSLPVVEGHCPTDCPCDEICVTEVVTSCAGSCSEQGAAHCVP